MLHSISGTMSHNAYNKNHDREKGSSVSLDQEYSMGIDSASGVFFNSDYRRHEDLKEMLDSNKDNLKLEAMKRIIGLNVMEVLHAGNCGHAFAIVHRAIVC